MDVHIYPIQKPSVGTRQKTMHLSKEVSSSLSCSVGIEETVCSPAYVLGQVCQITNNLFTPAISVHTLCGNLQKMCVLWREVYRTVCGSCEPCLSSDLISFVALKIEV